MVEQVSNIVNQAAQAATQTARLAADQVGKMTVTGVQAMGGKSQGFNTAEMGLLSDFINFVNNKNGARDQAAGQLASVAQTGPKMAAETVNSFAAAVTAGRGEGQSTGRG